MTNGRVQSSQAAGERALAGLRVLELSAGMAGPWVGRFMAYYGAEVIKVESKAHPDVTRMYVPPWQPELGVQQTMSPWFTDWNAGKRFIALDLARSEAVALCKRIVAECDVVVENYSAGVVDKLGLGYSALSAIKPQLVMLGSSGYGDHGPCSRYVTWGPNIEALAGLASVSGFADRDCTMTQFAYPDPLSAVHGLFVIMCALDHRRRTGRGQYINLSQLEATVSGYGHVMMEALNLGREPASRGNRSASAAPHGCYRCAGTDRWCAIAVTDEAAWTALCEAIGRPDLRSDLRFSSLDARLANQDELDDVIEAWTADRDPYDVMRELQAAGVAAGVVQNAEDLMRHDRHLSERGFFETVEHATRGEVVATGVPLGLTATPGKTGRSGAAIGQDNDYVFGELLGLSAREIDAHVAAGIIETAD